MNRCFVVQKQWYSHVMTSQDTQMKKNYQPRRLQLRLLPQRTKVSLWKSPFSAFTGDGSGAEAGSPGLFCQGVNWLPVPGRTLQPFKPWAVLTTPFHSLHLLPVLLALQVAVPYPSSLQQSNEASHTSLSHSWHMGCLSSAQRQLIKEFSLIFTPFLLMPTNCAIHIYDQFFKHKVFWNSTKVFFLWPTIM